LPTNLIWLSAEDIRNGIIRGDFSVHDVIDSLLNHIKRVNPLLNAIIYLDEELLWKEADKTDKLAKKGINKPLLGVPVTIKDNIHVKGMPTTYGSRLFKDNYPSEDAVLVERLRKAGAIIVGKTNLPELGLLAVTVNPLFGETRNPWDLSRTPGGSSGGAAAAVASGMGPVAIGNDAGGSIRIPSSFCGTYGFKPSPGLIPSHPSIPIFEGLSVDGPLTRYVGDAALVLDAISGPDIRDRRSLCIRGESFYDALKQESKQVRIAYSPSLGYTIIDNEVKHVVEEGVYRFNDIDIEVDEITLSLPDLGEELRVKAILETVEYLKSIGRYRKWIEVAFKPYRKYVSLLDDKRVYSIYPRIPMRTGELWKEVQMVFKKYDFLITPTVAVPPFGLEEGLGPREINGVPVGPVGWMGYTYPFNFTGQPAANIPVGFTKEGLPIGMQIIGKPYDDMGVLMLSSVYEEHFPWHIRKPVAVIR